MKGLPLRFHFKIVYFYLLIKNTVGKIPVVLVFQSS